MPDKKTYQQMLINSAEKFYKNLTWRTHFFLNPQSNPNKANKYGFKSIRAAPKVPELKPFEDDLTSLIKDVQYDDFLNPLQKDLKVVQANINSEPKVIIPADKTTNFYKMDPKDYNQLLDKNIQKEYKKEQISVVNKVHSTHKNIANNLEIQERIFRTVEREAFITLKDHKSNFSNNPSCRLLNPTKPELGKVSKKLLEKIISAVRQKSGLNQWKNTDSVLNWFKMIENKKKKSFIVFDVVNFYPTISSDLLRAALEWARNFIDISDQEIDIILQTKKSFLFSKGAPWSKKGDCNFDVAMGSFDGAESCDIVGLYILSELSKLKIDVGLYRDDGLGVSSLSPKQLEGTKKKICSIFKNLGLSITIEANKKIVDFLDVTMNLENDTYKPFIKPNDNPLYVSRESNHPPNVTKNIPAAVNRRLSAISSNEEMFWSAAPLYQEALNKSGYNYKLKYEPPLDTSEKKKRSRKRIITWFNPPFASNVRTNIGAKFLRLIDKHFPPDNPLSKLINRNTVKVSYMCTPNLAMKISAHNSKILNELQPKPKVRTCSCPKNAVCPLDGQCLEKNIVYQATVSSSDGAIEKYVGLTAPPFKKRLGNHKKSFKHEKYAHETTLSSYIWKLKDRNLDFDIKWKLMARATPFSPITNVCNLCTREKYFILFRPETATINSRNEINSHCRHKQSMLLDKT